MIPAWLRAELELRTRGVVVRSETVAELHARLRRERGIVWNGREWVSVR